MFCGALKYYTTALIWNAWNGPLNEKYVYIVHIKHINKRPDLDPRDHLTLIQQCKIKDAYIGIKKIKTGRGMVGAPRQNS